MLRITDKCSDGYGSVKAYNETVGKQGTFHLDRRMTRKKNRSIPHRRTRDHHAHETAEDYVEAVFDVIGEKGVCRVLDLAKHFDVSHVTVSRIVSRLQSAGLMETEPYRPIKLTKDGIALAKLMKKRHEIVYRFLLSLGVDQQTAQIDSEGIEHHVSKKTMAAMKRQLKNPA